jgi:hypothetical protein
VLDTISLRAVTKKLTRYRVKKSCSQSPSTLERLGKISQADVLRYWVGVSHCAPQNGHGETHTLPYQAIRLVSVTMHLKEVREKLTDCRVKRSGSYQSPCTSERSEYNSQSIEGCHQVHISYRAVQSGHGITNGLSNDGIGLMSVTVHLRAVTGKLTSCQIKPLVSCQSSSNLKQLQRNSLAVKSSNQDRVSHHATLSGRGELTGCQIKPLDSCQLPCSSGRSRRNSLAIK